MYTIKTLNAISPVGLAKLNNKQFDVAVDTDAPDGILVRSADMLNTAFNDNLLAIARAGAGVNNIPLDRCSEQGIVVFNTPGANANAVAELVIGMLIAGSRNVAVAAQWCQGLVGDPAMAKTVEKGKKQFVGNEIKGKTLGVIGLGAIGSRVADCAIELGMEVYGYDPYISIDAAWNLSSQVHHCVNLNDMLPLCDYITIHVPYLPTTKDTINAQTLALCKDGVKLLNYARGELVNTDALLEALDPEQNTTFNDHFIDMPFDLSHVLFITTANDLSAIPGPLRDRMDVIELPSYTRVEKYNIARKHLVPKQLKACGLSGKVTFSQSALYGIIDGYVREAGVRNLERTITSVLRKCARKIASGEVESFAVTGSNLEELLGPKMIKPDFLNRTNAVGIANGLAWTSVGGETLPIEVQVMDNGSGKITVTGSLGDVMKESAQLAVTYVRVHADEYGIDPERLKKCDLHIHAPEGAVPKDGPSAGVTLTTALVSCLSGIPVRGDVAMTGEITLHGNVLPIGGLREKSMAAYREGMKTVLIPKDNVSDLYEVDDEVKKNLQFLPMSNLAQVLNAALLKPKTVSARHSHPSKKAKKPVDAASQPKPAEQPKPGAVC